MSIGYTEAEFVLARRYNHDVNTVTAEANRIIASRNRELTAARQVIARLDAQLAAERAISARLREQMAILLRTK